MSEPEQLASAAQPAVLGAGFAPGTGDPAPARPKFDVVERRRQRAATQSRRRQATVLCVLGSMFVVAALAATAAAHAFIASDQQRLDYLQGQLTRTLVQQQALQLARAELESPARVLHIAENELGMTVPGSISYLAPVNPGPSVEQSEAASAGTQIDGTNGRTSAGPGTGSKSPHSGPDSLATTPHAR